MRFSYSVTLTRLQLGGGVFDTFPGIWTALCNCLNQECRGGGSMWISRLDHKNVKHFQLTDVGPRS